MISPEIMLLAAFKKILHFSEPDINEFRYPADKERKVSPHFYSRGWFYNS
jgi:hypothetical protein